MIGELRRWSPAWGAALIALGAVILVGPSASASVPAGVAATALAALAATGYLVLRARPSAMFAGAIALSIFAGNWELMHVPGPLGPERWLFVGAVAAVAMRAPTIASRPALRPQTVHWVMIVMVAYVVGSALAAGTLGRRGPAFDILQALGVLPYVVFVFAPLAFRSARDRHVLLVALVVTGLYLGLTALLEALKAYSLVFPRYITDPSVGIHAGRARGPFLEAVTMGAGLYACGIGAAIALTQWGSRGARVVAAAALVLCAFGLLFTLQRSVWIGGIVATLVAILVAPRLRRYALPIVAVGALGVVVALAVVPGLSERVNERRGQSETVWERDNMNRAALNMTERWPLFGGGWATFPQKSIDFYELPPTSPMVGCCLAVHNIFLTYAAETGLVGLTLWMLVIVLGVGGALMHRGPPEMLPWRIGLLAYAIFFVIVANFVFPQAFLSYVLWLLAAVVVSARYPSADRSSATRPDRFTGRR